MRCLHSGPVHQFLRQREELGSVDIQANHRKAATSAMNDEKRLASFS
jgi:hypothetical protein